MPVVRVSLVGMLLSRARLLFAGRPKRNSRFVAVTHRDRLPVFLQEISSVHDHLRSTLRHLRLSGLAASLDVRLQEAQASRLSHLEFLELILQDEVAVRDHRKLDRRTKLACFRDLKTLDQFDWDFNAALPRRQLFEMATCKFLDEARDVLLMALRAPARPTSPRRSATPPSSKAAPPSTAPSSTSSATSFTRKPSATKTPPSHATSGPTCSSSTTWA